MGDLLSPDRLLTTFGAFGIFVILFAETGLLIGFLLPGDTLLIAAGLLAATPVGAPVHLDLGAVLVGAVAGALIGAQVGYHIGRRFGPGLLSRPEGSRIGAGMRRSQDLLERFGPGKAIVLARFVPVARTLMNPLAGATGVPVRRFLLWQAAGGVLWTVGIVLLGYFLGATVPNIELYLVPALVIITVASVLPLVVRSVRQRRATGAQQASTDQSDALG
ncbi:DedA family protein [Kineococcus sp. SYSU DK001]|uniref:DedA family protein n=1 Tax=Kineococcus sp. SYSU DK001 TaxID=3383122 RepID=UPI003D7CB0CD